MNRQNGKNGLLCNFVCLTEQPVTYKRVEFEMDMPLLPVGYNPFNERDVAVSVTLVSAVSGTSITMPGFCYQDCAYDEKGNQTGLCAAPCFRLRVCLPEAGRWDYIVTLTIRDRGEDSVSGSLTVAEGVDTRGFIRVEPNRQQNFMFDDGTPYVAIGQNIAGARPVQPVHGHSAYYRDKFQKCAAQKANFARVWSVSFSLYLLNRNLDPSYMDLANCHQFDRIFEYAEESDIYIDFVLYHHGQFSRRPGLPERDYHNCAYNMELGGYLDDPAEFFTNKRAIRDAKSLFRYAVARWGYSTHVMCWEFFNEQDITDAGSNSPESEPQMTQWHQEMCDYFREIDPYKHLLTTSCACYSNRVVRHEMFDFISLHTYNYRSLSLITDLQKNDYRTFHRPVLFGELGINERYPGFVGARCGEDKLELHQQHWIGVMGGGAGTGANWFWDEMDATDSYDTFRAVAEMAQRIPWQDPALQLWDKEQVITDNPLVVPQGYGKADGAWLWLYDDTYNHTNRVNITTYEAVSVTLPLIDGDYILTWIDPWSGNVITTTEAMSKDGILKAEMPSWQKDIAVTVLPK